MRNALKLLAPVSLLVLVACSEASDESAADTAASMAEAGLAVPQTGEAVGDAAAPPGSQPPIPVSLPKMSYVFDYGFRGRSVVSILPKLVSGRWQSPIGG